MENKYFDSSFLNILKKLKIMTTSKFKGSQAGGRKTFASGSSIEFSDYRVYSPGDDLRFVDWNLFARLDEMFIKVFHNEENTNVFIFLDVSRSMRFGDPLKIEFGKKVAAAIAYIALAQRDTVQLVCYSDRILSMSKPYHHPGEIMEIFALLNDIGCTGEDRLDEILKQFFLKVKRKGVAFIISDLWDLPALDNGLKNLKYYKFDANILHIVDNSEIAFNNYGDWDLVDSESQETIKVDVDEKVANLFSQKIEQHFLSIEKLCSKFSFFYQRTLTSAPFEYLVMQYFSRRR